MIRKTIQIGNPAKLSLRQRQLMVEGEERSGSIPIEDIGIVIIDHPQVYLSASLLSALLSEGVVVIHCDEKHLPHGMSIPLHGHHLHAARLREQIETSQPLQKQLWSQIIVAKLEQQANVLKTYGKPHMVVQQLAEKVKSGDPENLEARAAIHYWKYLFNAFYDDFTRDAEIGGINSMLNYAYAILRAIVARALVGAGLHPALGVWHRNQYNMYALADDLMEPYRPFADRMIMEYLMEHGEPDELTPPIKRILLQLPVREVQIEQETTALMSAVQRSATSLAKCYTGEKRKLALPDAP